jgi:dsRNA-specific ribonuclease
MENQVSTKPEFDGKKSSISILQELAIQVESPPVYDLVEMSGLPHSSFFKVQVRFVGFSATGSGPKKQLAKHSAAKYETLLLYKSIKFTT